LNEGADGWDGVDCKNNINECLQFHGTQLGIDCGNGM
jgi:hypothetical protein